MTMYRIDECLSVELTGVYATHGDDSRFYHCILHPKHAQVASKWRMREPVRGEYMEASPAIYYTLIDYLEHFCGLDIGMKGISDFVKQEIEYLAPFFRLDLSKYLTVEVIGADNKFGFKVLRVHGNKGNCRWEMREPIWSHWMQADMGTFPSILDYLSRYHWVACTSEEVNAFIRKSIDRTPYV